MKTAYIQQLGNSEAESSNRYKTIKKKVRSRRSEQREKMKQLEKKNRIPCWRKKWVDRSLLL